jgi:rhamnogalacturonan endolyase
MIRGWTRAAAAAIVGAASLTLCQSASAQKQVENLGRGVVAVNQGQGKVFVSWRLLGTEYDKNIAFNVYRAVAGAAPVKLTAQPITNSTNYVDTSADLTKDNAYFVKTDIDGAESADLSKPFLNKIAANSEAKQYFEIPLKLPPNTQCGDGSVADLDGDGEYEIVIKGVQHSLDTASAGLSGNAVLQAYKLDGTLMWTIQLGKNIREGEHDTQVSVYDLDGDGRAEVAVRTADGTIDGTGKAIGDPNADWVDRTQGSRTYGKILKGPEYYSIFDGRTGAELTHVEYVPTREPLDGWGGIGGNGGNDSTGNRNNRFLATVAYLDGVHPSVIACRGYYGRSVLAAWDWRGGKLTSRWVFDSGKDPNGGLPYVTQNATVDPAVGLNKITDNAGHWDGAKPGEWMMWQYQGVKERRKVVAVNGNVITVDEPFTPGANKDAHVYGYSGMGAHWVSVADVDGDGKDEIVYHSMVVDDDGKGLYTTGLRHGDALHVGDLDPEHPGLEVFGIHENEGSVWDVVTPAAAMYDAKTGKILWSVDEGGDAGRGLSGDIDPRYPGEEQWGIPGGLFTCKGQNIAPRGPSMTNFAIWWDGDPLREMVDRNLIAKWDWQNGRQVNILTAEGCAAAVGTKQSPVVMADLFGDWREEVVFRTQDNSALRVYTTTDPTSIRLFTLMHDPQYRCQVAGQNTAYNQPPHPSFYLGDGMKMPPKPNIVVVGK